MASIALSNIPKIPIEQMVALPLEDLLELARDAKNVLAEAKGQKDWIDCVITLKILANDQDNHNAKNNNYFGGQNEQTTDY